MTNHIENCKNAVIEDIIANLESVDILTLYDIRRKIEKFKPLHLEEFVNKNYDEYSEGFKKDLIHEVKRVWLKISPGCTDTREYIQPYSEDEPVESVWDITIHGESPDMWIIDYAGTVFNPTDIAIIIFNIYIGKVVW